MLRTVASLLGPRARLVIGQLNYKQYCAPKQSLGVCCHDKQAVLLCAVQHLVAYKQLFEVARSCYWLF
jgi:hypothetical protein